MLFVVIDEYSRYPVVEGINSTSANTVITALDKILSMFSICDVVKTVNEPPFQRERFSNFVHHMGFKHRKITSMWPKANSESERFMRTLQKSLKISHITNKNWRQELQSFLRAYRSTPHCTTKMTPHEMLFERKPKTRVPECTQLRSSTDETVRERDASAKARMKAYADKKNRAAEFTLKLGDTVLVKQQRQNKLSSYYDLVPYTISAMNGSMVTASRKDETIVRNSSFFKRITPPNDIHTYNPNDIHTYTTDVKTTLNLRMSWMPSTINNHRHRWWMLQDHPVPSADDMRTDKRDMPRRDWMTSCLFDFTFNSILWTSRNSEIG